MITITSSARKKVLSLLENEGQEGLALRFGIAGRGAGGWQYQLGFMKEEDRTEDDTEVDAGGFKVLIDEDSVENLKGTTLDYLEGIQGSGFKIDNPNPLWKDAIAQAVQDVIDSKINPGVAAHGGHVSLLDVREGKVYIALGGGCQGCGMVDVTLKSGIEVLIKNAVPQITQIIDSTDHAGGDNPYYQPGKGEGASALK